VGVEGILRREKAKNNLRDRSFVFPSLELCFARFAKGRFSQTFIRINKVKLESCGKLFKVQ
jgi:hypothetical protein